MTNTKLNHTTSRIRRVIAAVAVAATISVPAAIVTAAPASAGFAPQPLRVLTMNHSKKFALTAIAATLVVLLVGPGLSAAGAAPAPREHCVEPGPGDLNEFFGTDNRIITPSCTVALVGEHWTPLTVWVTNTTHAVIPEGYTPSRSTPIEDFNAKFVGARYVIDGGTNRARTYSFSASQILKTGLTVPGTDFPVAAMLAVLHPLPPGRHTVDIFRTLSADHWDGFGLDSSANLFPAGESYCGQLAFTVTKPDNQTKK